MEVKINKETDGREAFTFRENSIVVTIPLHRIKKVGNKVGNKKRIKCKKAKNHHGNER